MSVHPQLLWAQRSSEFDAEKNIVFLTISVPELDPKFTFTIDGAKIAFKGESIPPKASGSASAVAAKTYEFNLELFGEVEEVRRTLNGKNLALVLKKSEAQEDYWPRLTKEKVKLNFVKTDFGKWKDQDEQDTVEPVEEEAPRGPPGEGMGGGPGGPGGMDMAAMMQQMGGMGGMGGAGGAGGMDFEKLMAQMGQGGGMGGMGDMPDMSEQDGLDLDLDDDDEPSLEDLMKKGKSGEDDDDEGPPPLEEA